jgi:hypothetical protein
MGISKSVLVPTMKFLRGIQADRMQIQNPTSKLFKKEYQPQKLPIYLHKTSSFTKPLISC